jgi:hypothetical protein
MTKKNIPSLPPAFDIYLIVFLVYLINVPVHTCTALYSTHYLIQVPIHQASSNPCSGKPSARRWGWGGEVRYRTSFSPKSRSGTGGSGSAGTFTYLRVFPVCGVDNGGAAHLGYLLPVTVETPAANLTLVFFLSVA